MKYLLCLLTGLLAIACTEKGQYQTYSAGSMYWRVSHEVNGQPLKLNISGYTNAAGNEYIIAGLKYFISDVTLYGKGNLVKTLTQPKDIYYIDEEIPSTKEIFFNNVIPAGEYDSVSFVFGITGEKNISYRFVNPPENLMAWPDALGGGYHYMKLDGKWKDINAMLQPFNFHLGIGQLYHGTGYNTDSIYAFVQNWFRVSLPGTAFTIRNGELKSLRLVMNISNWFTNPHDYNFNYWGGAVMQNQEAQQTIRENGWNVFSIRWEKCSP